MKYDNFYQSDASLNSVYLSIVCCRDTGWPLLAVHFKAS